MPQNLLDPNRVAPQEVPTDYIENAPGHVGQPGPTPEIPPPPLPGEEEGIPWQVHGPFDQFGNPPEHPALPPYEEPIPPGETIPPDPIDPPINVDKPYASFDGAQLHCTMGNWIGEPTDYAYQWNCEGANISTDNPYTTTPEDIDKGFVCGLIASNAAGSSELVWSNSVVVSVTR